MKIRPVGAEIFYADWRTGGKVVGRHDEAKDRFSQFCKCA
jgi:hypothetical protein